MSKEAKILDITDSLKTAQKSYGQTIYEENLVLEESKNKTQ